MSVNLAQIYGIWVARCWHFTLWKQEIHPHVKQRFPLTPAKNIWKLSYPTQITSCPYLPPGYTHTQTHTHTNIHTLTHSCPKIAIMVVWFQIHVFLIPRLRLFALNRDLENPFFIVVVKKKKKANPFFCYLFNCKSNHAYWVLMQRSKSAALCELLGCYPAGTGAKINDT